MTKHNKEVLNELSKEQLIYLIEQLCNSQFLIGEVCVEESKYHIGSKRAVDKIRNYLCNLPSMNDATYLKTYITDRILAKIPVYENGEETRH